MPNPAEAAGSRSEGEPGCVIVQGDNSLPAWGRSFIESTGTAAAPRRATGAQAKALARRGAIVDLQRNLLRVLNGVHGDLARSEARGIIRNIELLEGTWNGEYYTVTGRIRLLDNKIY